MTDEALASLNKYLRKFYLESGLTVDKSFSILKIVCYCVPSRRVDGVVEENFAYLRMEPIDDLVHEASCTAMQRKPVTVLDVQEHPVVDKRKPIVAYERTWPVNETTERLIGTFGESLTGKRRGPTAMFGAQPESCQPFSDDLPRELQERNSLVSGMRHAAQHDWESDPWLSETEFWHFASTLFVYRHDNTFVERLIVFPLGFEENLNDATILYSEGFASTNPDYDLVAQQLYDGHYVNIDDGVFAFLTLRDPSVGIEEYAALFND